MAEGSRRGRGRAILFQNSSQASTPISDDSLYSRASPDRPKGRAALFGTKSSSSVTKTSSSGISEEWSQASTPCDDSLYSSASSDRPKGRAALFGTKSGSSVTKSSSSGIYMEDELQTPVASSRDTKSPVMKHGISGKKTEVACNYVRLELTNPDRRIWEYDVSFSPEVDRKSAKIQLVNKHFRALNGKVKVYDVGFRLWTPMETKNEVESGVYELYDNDQSIKVLVSFKRKREVKFSKCKNIVNIIMKRIMGELHFVRFRRADYNPHMSFNIPEIKLEVWPGYVTAVDEYEGGILLNCDVSHRLLQCNTVYDVMKEIGYMLTAKGAGNLSYNEMVLKTLLGTSVITKYNNKNVKIHDIDFEKTPMSTFDRKGKQVTYVDYYKTQYNLIIRDLKQPLLMNRMKKYISGTASKEAVEVINYYVPELCSPTGLTDAQRNDNSLMRVLANRTQVSPEARDRALTEFLKNIHANENCNKMLLDWGLRLPTESVRLDARTLEPETILFGRGRKVQEANADWGRAMSNAPVLKPINIEEWAIVYSPRDAQVANEFRDKCLQISTRNGIRLKTPRNVRIQNEFTPTYYREIQNIKDNCQMVVIIVPNLRDDRYGAVKNLCIANLGLPCQVIHSRTLRRGRNIEPIVSKLLLQMNCKLGGWLWSVSIPYKEEGVMICGLDVYHDPGRRKPSVIALVASINSDATGWTSATAQHTEGQEISNKITALFQECLQQYFKMNGSYPKRIIMYRDGTSDGQLETVRDFEIPQLIRMLSQVHDDYSPMLTYIIVQKRINTRFYMRMSNERIENPRPGTILDHTVTRRDWHDFFLASQNVKQGTVSPTHYIVVYDTSNMSTDMIQKITNKMTYLYYNWCGTIRNPAPCLYAHKLAYLHGQHMHKGAQAHEALRNTLYFLEKEVFSVSELCELPNKNCLHMEVVAVTEGVAAAYSLMLDSPSDEEEDELWNGELEIVR